VAWTLIGVATAVVLGLTAIVGFVGFEIVTAQPVTIRNDQPAAVRMSGECLDDALDLSPGQSGVVDVSPGDPVSCDVYVNYGYKYEGCLRLRYSQVNAVISLRSAVQDNVSESSCDSGG
jgi:hypothetical protein